MAGAVGVAENCHTAAVALLWEAREVVGMHKVQREAYYLRVKGQRGQQAVADLVTVVNTVRRASKGEQ